MHYISVDATVNAPVDASVNASIEELSMQLLMTQTYW